MAVNLPGAPDVARLWRVLQEGINTVHEIPSSRFDIADYRDNTDGSGRVLQSIRGNFLEDAEVFDNTFFRVSPREARNMDPQQRVLLHAAYHALENAGYVPSATPSFDPDNIAVYVGAATNDYLHNLRDQMDVYYTTGTLQAFLSGKVSYAFGFGGPSVVVDTACSSSVVAIHQACRSLQAGDCNAALAGGVNVITSPDMHIGLDRAHFLSPTGQCRPWDASADGYCRAEGCGMFVLKRLTDALAENDRVLAVIRGAEVNQSGTADSITHPHVATQARLFRRVLDAAGVRPGEVTVVEAHGTGTRAGDPAEVEALREVFGAGAGAEGVVHLTSVKANIGHAEAASGAASLAKLVLMMRYRVIPKTISLKKLSPRIAPLEKDRLRIDMEASAWNPAAVGGRRIAMLNNFGAAGSNAALLLEEPPATPAPLGEQPQSPVVLGLSCDSPEAVEILRQRCITELTDHPPDAAALVDLAYTITARRQLYRYRIAVSGRSSQEICRALRTAPVVRVGERKRKVVFLFSGQGSQYRGLGSGLYEAVSSFREAVDVCHGKLVSWGYAGVTDTIKGQAESAEDDLVGSQCALFVLEYALARMWQSWGVQPDVVIGHSLGEYAALVCAEVIDLDDALRLIAGRARLMSRLCLYGATGMLAVRASASGVEELLKAHGELSIACYNSDGDCVVGGPLALLEGFQSACQSAGYSCRRLSVPFAFHTDAISPIMEEMRSLSAKARFSAPTITLVSTALGAVVQNGGSDVFTPEYFAKHCRDPVLFRQGIHALLDHDTDIREAVWLEIGPNAVTSPLLRGNGICADAVVVSTLRKDQSDVDSLGYAHALLYCSGTTLNWRSVFADLAPGAKVTDAPLYPFANTRFWVPYTETRRRVPSRPSRKPSSEPMFLDSATISKRIRWPPSDSDQPAVLEIDITELARYIDGHQVVGTPLCPASVYNELVLAASRAWCERIGIPPFASSLVLSDISYKAPLIHASGQSRIVRVEVAAKGTEGGFNAQFAVRSGVPAREDLWQTHCTGTARADLLDSVTGRLSHFRNKIQEHIATLQLGARNTRTVYASTLYDEIFSKVVKYSDTFRTLKAITIRCDGADAYALAQHPVADAGESLIRPVLMDTLLHAAGLMLNLESNDDGYIFVCCHAQTVIMLPDHLRVSAMFGMYVQIGYVSQSMAIADAYAIDLEGAPGQVFAHIGKIRFRRLSITGFKAILSASVHESTSNASPSSPTLSSTIASIHNPSVHDCVLGLISQLCEIPVAQINPDAKLEHLGVDSLLSIELTGRLNSLCPSANLSPRTLSTLNQVNDLVDLVERNRVVPTDARRGGSQQWPEEFNGVSIIEYVKTALSSVLDIPVDRLDDDDHLDRLGLDSLSSIELRHTFSSALCIHVPQDVLAFCATIKDLSIALAGLSNRAPGPLSNSLAAPNPILLQDGDGQTPLFLIHDGSGVVHPYMSLHDLTRTVWGIHNPKLLTGDDWPGGVPELATHYADLVKGILHAGQSCILGGWSFGGVVAFEVARMLIVNGTPVHGLVFIDSPYPQMGVHLPEAIISAVVGAKVHNPRHAELVRLQMRYASKALLEYDPRSSLASHVAPPKAVMLRSQDGYGYNIDTADSETATARFLTDRRDPATSVAGWEELLGSSVPVLDIPGNHFQPFEPENVATVTKKLGKALEMLENRPTACTPDA